MDRSRRGTILIIVLGILVLMALLATTFVTLQSIERNVTHNYTDEVRAKLVAQSGVERAVDRLHQIAATGWYPAWTGGDSSWHYFGSETDESRAYNLQSSAAEYAKLQTPLEDALNPSFANELDDPADPEIQNPADAVTAPRSVKIEGRTTGFSGWSGGTYSRHGDLFTLKTLDCQSQININDGARWGNRHSVSQNVRRILNVLGAQPEANIAGLGDKVIGARPPGGYSSKVELQRVLGDAAYARVRDLLTTHSWSNPNVVNPVPLSAEEYRPDLYPIHPANSSLPGDGYARPVDGSNVPIYRYGHGRDVFGTAIDRASRPWPLRFWDAARDPSATDLRYSRMGSFYHAIWSRDSLNPQWIETVERSPVNVNTAARPVLMALTVGLEGFFELSRRRPVPFDLFYGWTWHYYNYAPESGNASSWQSRGSETGFLYRTVPYLGPAAAGTTTSNPTAGVQANRVVDEILACRYRKVSPGIAGLDYALAPFGGPFRSWQQFNEFVDHLVKGGLITDARTIFYDYKPSYTVASSWSDFDTVKPWTVTDVVTVSSPVQIRFASQAAADVLKANFNPNLHLNELNPDRNLYTHVDKTDLLVNSTELCFVPMGRFEVESIGYLLAPPSTGGSTALAADRDALTASDNRVAAKCRIHSVVELYWPNHETAQKQFYQGEFGERKALPTTNNNRATECGPEVDNGPPPLECEYSGYVALPTVGGHYDALGWSKAKGELRTGYSMAGLYGTAALTAHGTGCSLALGSAIHSHLTFDHCAHHHGGGAAKCAPTGRWPNTGEQRSQNYLDKTEATVRSPYSPTDSVFETSTPGRYRLCRSYSLPPSVVGSSTVVVPPPAPRFRYSPSDLRLDGAYGELNSAFGYDTSTIPASTHVTVSFWLKANWFPENTGKIRTFLSMNNYEEFFRTPNQVWAHNGWWRFPRPLPYGLYHFPSYYTFEDPWRPSYLQPPRINSMIWAMSTDSLTTNTPGGYGIISPTLNHEFEPYFNSAATEDWDRFTSSSHPGTLNQARAHEWIHVAVSATSGATAPYYTWPPWSPGYVWWYYTNSKRLTFYVNGQELPGGDQLTVHLNEIWQSFSFFQGKSIRFGGEYGQMSQAYTFPGAWYNVSYKTSSGNIGITAGCPSGTFAPYRQYWADATLDELYYWRDTPTSLTTARDLFLKGRYYRPIDPDPDTDQGDGLFTSQPMTVKPRRGLAPGNSIVPAGASGDTTVLPSPLPDTAVYLSAVSWTAVAEDVTSVNTGVWRIKPIVRDYRNLYTGGAPIVMSPAPGPDVNGFSYETVAQMFVVVDGPFGRRAYGPYHNEVFSPIRDSHRVGAAGTGTTQKIKLEPGEYVKYVVKLRTGNVANTLLLSTPVLDDVTLFFEHSGARYVTYSEVRSE
jgi:hypothetical protein